MASEDVIELGSSDDEAEPAIKKIKPTPNAMVHIPRKIHGVTIKPAKPNVSSSIPKELAGKNVTVTKISKGINILANPYAIKSNKPNGKQVQIKPILPKQLQQRPSPSFPHLVKKPIAVQNKTSVNPLSLIKKINSQVVINKVPSTTKILKNALKIQSPATINNLPPSITVTRTAGGQKRVAPVNVTNVVRKKQKINNIPKTIGEVLTVDLDDDEVSSSSTASPQWYLRPEEQDKTTKIEEENNKEPEPSKSSQTMIEITIEDSPAKPKDKRTCEVGAEHTVTIDDSPVKMAAEKSSASGSDGEAKTVVKVPQSKKKLEYPKEAEVINDIVEIEISPIMVEDPTIPVQELQEMNTAKPDPPKEDDNIIEIEESPLKVQGHGTSTPKKNHPQPKLAVPESIKELQGEPDDLGEFHPVYQSFIRLCFQLENSDDMKKIVEKKIKTYYRQVPKEYTESEEFTDMVASKVLAMKAGPEKMYLYIKDIVDELNLQRKMAKSQVLSNINEKKSGETEKYYYGADGEYDSKRQRQIRKLEKTLKKLHRAIQKLEDQEVDFDDEEDSVYLLTESDEGSTSNKDSDRHLEKDPKALLQRYKERMVRVHAKFCQLTNTKMPSEPRVQLDARPGQASGPAKRLEKWINKKVPIGTPLPFPDFHDVLRCVREANDEDKLGWNEADIMEEARDLFTRCGKKLQRRRQENEWRIAASRISVEVDPAEQHDDLKKKLDDNKKIAAKKETEVFNKYADRQNQLKLEAEEIGDKEAEESPADEDEEEDIERTDETSLENKEKRKERLKRLLQEKSKKAAAETEKIKEKTDSKTDSGLQDKEHNADKNDIAKDTQQKQDDTDVQNNKDNENKKQNENKIDIEKDTNQDIIKTTPENKDVSENESVKTIDSDSTSEKETKIQMVENEKIKQNITSSAKNKTEIAHSISDDSSKLESDVDELHLLQKLHSENEINSSTLESSDSETPIAISDTLGSSSDANKKVSSDVISIENSSYSESEVTKELPDTKGTENMENKVIEEVVDSNTELECSNVGIEKKQARTNNDEYNESVEDILLASTDDEVETEKSVKPIDDEECVNLKDDSLSIGDTVVEGVDEQQDSSHVKQDDASSIESVACVSLKDDSPVEVNMEEGDEKISATDNDVQKNGNTIIESIENTDLNSTEIENSVQSVQMIELKESSSEKEMDVIDESSLDDKGKENSSDEVMDTIDSNETDKPTETIEISTKSMDSESKEKSPEEVIDTIDESLNNLSDNEEPTAELLDTAEVSTNSMEIEGKESLPEEILDAIDESMKSLGSESTTDKIIELPNDKL